MHTVLNLLKDVFYEAVQAAYPELQFHYDVIEITPSTAERFGHFQCNSAMKLAKKCHAAPRAIAEAILRQLDNSDKAKEMMSAWEIAGPGFINLTLSDKFLSQRVNEMVRDAHLGIDVSGKAQKLVIDFSSPNVAKEMHVGHLRSTIIGDCIARLFEFLGYDVLRLNHIGNWGTQFGMLIAYLKQYEPDVIAGKKKTDLTHLVQWYRASKQCFDEDAEFKKQAQLEVVALQSGDPENIKAWEKICEISRIGYQEIYDLLDIKLIERGESFYNPFLKPLIADLAEKNLLTESDGAQCIFMEGFKNRDGNILPMILQKSDGGFNYATTDLASLRHRVEVEHGNRVIYVTDAGQATHFAMVIKAAEKAGYVDPKQVRVDHVAFGLVLGPDGKKFKTRSGDTEKLIDLLTAAVAQAEQALKARNHDLTAEQAQAVAQVIGIDAVKYADLSTNRVHDYSFSYERMLKFEGNTAVFLMYSYVRIAGIKRKVGQSREQILKGGEIRLEHPSEITLALHLARFGEILELIVDDLMPNHLTDYLYTLAEKFNAFFRDCRVEGSPEQASRLLLCELTASVLQCGFHILGLATVERM